MSPGLTAGSRYCGDFSVARIEAPAAADFDRDYACIGKPAIITNLFRETRAARRWTPDYLVKAVGAQKVTLTRLRNRKLRSNNARYTVAFSEYAERAFANDPEAGKYCLQQIALPKSIAADIPTPDLVGRWLRVRPHFWLSTPGHVTETHRDANHNLLAQVIGTKKLTLFSPVFTGALYSHRAGSRLGRYSRVDLDCPDLYRFPEARELVSTEVTLHAGETLFLPVYWWHRVETVEVSVSVNFWWAPPLHLALHSRQLPVGGTPEEVFQAIHTLADLSPFPSEFEVIDHLWSEGFRYFAAACLYQCVSLLITASGRRAAGGREHDDLVRSAKGLGADTYSTIASVLESCRLALEQVGDRRKVRPRRGMVDVAALVGQTRQVAIKLGCADLFCPSRWIPDHPDME